jgi:hypothetical protein
MPRITERKYRKCPLTILFKASEANVEEETETGEKVMISLTGVVRGSNPHAQSLL